MFCSNCGNQIEDGSKFCPACGKSLTAEAQAPVEPAEKVAEAKPKKEKKPVNKKTVKLISLVSGGLALVILLFYAIPTFFIPWAKLNKAKSLSNAGNHVEAYNVVTAISTNAYGLLNIYAKEQEYATRAFNAFVDEGKYEEAYDFAKDKGISLTSLGESDSTGFIMDLINEYMKSCKVGKAMQLYYDYYWDNAYISSTISSTIPEQIAEADRENLYNAIVKILDNEKLWDTLYNAESPARAISSVSVLSYMLSSLPNDYNNAGKLKMFCDGIANNFGGNTDKYVYDNRALLATFWELDSVRSLVSDDYNIEAYLDGEWKNTETDEHLTFSSSPYSIYPNSYSTNLKVPDVASRYYDIVDMTFIYCNEGSSKVCDVFKLSFDPVAPYKLNVYCYEDGRTVTLVKQ